MTTPLPPTDPPAPDDKLPGEAELAALYRQLPQTEPDPALDAAVLHTAAQALESTDEHPLDERRKVPRESDDLVHPKPLSAIAARAIPSIESASRRRRRRVPHWLVGLGSAASLVLVAGLAWQMRKTPEASPIPAETSGGTDMMKKSTPPTPSLRTDAIRTEVSTLASSAQAPPQPKSQPSHLPPAALPGLKPVAPGRSATEAAPYTLSDKPIERDDAAARDAMRRAVLQKRAASAPKQPASADESRVVAAPPPVMEAAPPAPPASMPREDSSTAANPGDTPQQELAKIQLLMQQDREAEARQRLQAFHRAHPQWSLPADLRGLLDGP